MQAVIKGLWAQALDTRRQKNWKTASELTMYIGSWQTGAMHLVTIAIYCC